MRKSIILAADKLTLVQACDLAERFGQRITAVKIHNLYDQHGPAAVEALRESGARVWVDFKLHDIPETVAERAKALAAAGASIITVHADGGIEMMKAAVEAVPGVDIFAVTELTSQFATIEAVIERVCDAYEAGVAGFVCSPKEVGYLTSTIIEGNDQKIMDLSQKRFATPGIRSHGKDVHDQKRVGTARQALLDGATDLVIGRQITLAADPVAALDEIEAEIADL